MAVEVILPKVDMDMATGIISKWHVKNGDVVKKGAVLFEMETDKSAIEIESPGDGEINNIITESGVAVNIGTVVAMIYATGEKLQEAKVSSPIMTATIETVAEKIKPIATIVANGTGMRATPLARRLARQKNIALSSITGSGPRGRVIAEDVKKFETPSGNTQFFSHAVPHFSLSASCDLTELLALIDRINPKAPRDADQNPQWQLSINDYVVKALALALQRVPAANVANTDGGILQHHSSDVGVAIAMDGKVFTPILRNADTKSLSQISLEMKDLATRASAHKLQMADYQGGTTTISNLGMYGIEQYTANINPPHTIALAVGAPTEKFLPVNKQPVVKTMMTCTLSCDHRAVNGVVGAELLQAFRAFIQEPALMLA
jgi:pyruvate dehydrogenase E2 component (dihydrolipoamide acetyltransferase)